MEQRTIKQKIPFIKRRDGSLRGQSEVLREKRHVKQFKLLDVPFCVFQYYLNAKFLIA